jgi:hypothetical protein
VIAATNERGEMLRFRHRGHLVAERAPL